MASASKVIFVFFVTSLAAMVVSGFQFDVGHKTGWTKPTGKDPETYNEWAAQNRFRIGDTLYFKYQNDSVLVVNPTDYLNCNTENPITKFEDGNSVFRFDRSGFFYFMSGQTDHCRSGQKLIIRVIHPSEEGAPVPPPELAPSPAPAGGGESPEDGSGSDSGTPSNSSAMKIKTGVASISITVVAGVMVILYMFM